MRSLAVAIALVFALMLAGTGHAEEPRAWGVGVSIADPVGLTVKRRLGERLGVQGVLGLRVLERGNELTWPGPLAAADGTVQLVSLGPLALHAGAGFGVGWVRAGCWYDAVAEFCVEGTRPSALLRIPVGVDLWMAPLRSELSFEAVPALRLFPQLHGTFMGGFALRYWL